MPITARPPTQELVNLVGALGGKWHCATAMCRCPSHADGEASLSLRQGDRGILVHCFAGCASDDVLRELRRVRPGQTYSRPVITEPRDPGLLITRMWSEGRPIAGTAAERYLLGRRLDPRFADLRYHPRCPKGAKPLTVFLPALLVGVRNTSGSQRSSAFSWTSNAAAISTKCSSARPGREAGAACRSPTRSRSRRATRTRRPSCSCTAFPAGPPLEPSASVSSAFLRLCRA